MPRAFIVDVGYDQDLSQRAVYFYVPLGYKHTVNEKRSVSKCPHLLMVHNKVLQILGLLLFSKRRNV